MGIIKKYKPKQDNVKKLMQYLNNNKTTKKVLYKYGK